MTLEKLREPFAASEIKFFATALTKDKTKGKVAPYADARAYMERLDHSVGPENWSTAYEVLDQTRCAVECRLSINIDGVWVTKADVGYPNEAKDADNGDKEPLKAAYSDALKRACVEWGVGRFLYDLKLKKDWLPVDEWGRFTEQPVILGANEKPEPEPAPKPAAAKTKKEIEQWGSFLGANGTFNTDAWNEAQRPLRAQISDLTGGDIKKWLAVNTGKSLDDLIDLAKGKEPAHA